MGKRQQDKHPFEDNPFLDGFSTGWTLAEGERSREVSDIVWRLLEQTDVDAKRRKIIWDDGKTLSITESVQRIHADYPDFPLEMIEEHLIGWLEMEFAPPTYSQEQLDELDRLTEKWIEDHERQAEAPPKTGKNSALLSMIEAISIILKRRTNLEGTSL